MAVPRPEPALDENVGAAVNPYSRSCLLIEGSAATKGGNVIGAHRI